MKIAFQMDPIGAVNINADSTFRIAEEAQARGHELFYYGPDQLAFEEGRITARGHDMTVQRVPGDPAVQFAGAMATEESIQQVRETLGLDKPLPQQFVLYLSQLAQGDLGQSLSTGRPVLTDLASRLPASLELTLVALLLSCLVSVPLGVLAATRPGSWVDQLCRLLVTAGVSLPTFFTGVVLIYIFYYLLGIAPSPLGRLDFIYLDPPRVTGFFLIDSALAGDGETWFAALRQLILPACTLALFTLAPIARMTRAAMLLSLIHI